MKKKISFFINDNLIYIVLLFGLLSLLPYVKFFKALEIDRVSGIIYRAVVLGLYLILCLFTIARRPNKSLIIPLSLYSFSGLLTIFLSPVINKIEVPLIDQFIGIAIIFGNVLSIFIAFFLLNDYDIKIQKFRNVIIFSIVFGIIICLYTYIFEYEDIKNTFVNEYGWNYDVTSVFSSKTTYGYCLFAISLYIIYYALISNRYWLYSFPLFFLTNAFISRSKTTILCLFIVLIGLSAFYIIRFGFKNKKKWIITLSIFIPVLVTIIVLICLKIGPFAILNTFITKVIFADGIVVVNDRLTKSQQVLNSIKSPFNIIFGCGERITNYLIAPAKISGDEVYVSTFATGGLIKMSLYVFLIIYIFYKYINNSVSKPIKLMQCIILSAYLIAGLFESDSLVGINTGLLLTFAIYSSNSIINKIPEATIIPSTKV